MRQSCAEPVVGCSRGNGRTQTLLESLDVAALGAALPPLLIVGAIVAEAGTCAATGANAIALELALSANHASQSLGLGDVGVVGDGVAGFGILVGVHAVVGSRHFGCDASVGVV